MNANGHEGSAVSMRPHDPYDFESLMITNFANRIVDL
jgi:hypothetical protein